MVQEISLGLAQTTRINDVAPTAGLTNIVAPVVSGTPEIGQTLSVSNGYWTGAGAISYTFQWFRNGTVIPGATASAYDLASTDDFAAVTAEVTATDNNETQLAVAAGVQVTYPIPVFSTQPSISPLNAPVGSTFTVFEGIATPNATLSIEYFTLNGADKSGGLIAGEWSSVGEAAGDVLMQVVATNSGGSVQSGIVGAVLEAAATIPGQFQTGGWSVANAATGGSLVLTLSSIPTDGGSAITVIQYQLDGAGWVSVGVTTPGGFQIGGLVDDQPYSIAIRAVNAIGSGPASAPKIETPTTAAGGPESIRFGTANGAGTGAYDTGGTAVDGTYGAFTVSLGVVTPSGSQVPGAYYVGGVWVDVNANYHAVASQSEWAALVSGSPGSLSGMTVVVRKGAGISTANSTSYQAIFRADVDCTISGDGHTAFETANWHFDNVTFTDASGITFEDLSFKSFYVNSTSGGGYTKNPLFRRCHFGSNDPNINGDYSSARYNSTGLKAPFWTNGVDVIQGVGFVDCTFRGSGEFSGSGSRIRAAEYLIFVGNHTTAFYGDGTSFVGSGNPVGIVGGNVWSEGFGDVDDGPGTGGGPHMDDFQLYGFDNAGITFEGNMHDIASARGKNNANTYIAEGGATFDGVARACGMLSKGYNGLLASQLRDFDFEHMGVLPNSDHAGSVGYNLARITLGGSSGTTNLINSFGNLNNVNGSIVQSGNVDIRTFTKSALDTALPGWSATHVRPSYQQILDKFSPAPTEALAGKGPHPVIATGVAQSEYVIATSLAPAPILSGAIAIAVGSFGSGQVTTDVAKGFVRWAIVPSGSGFTASDWQDLLFERLPGALEYGTTTQKSATIHNWTGSVTLTSGNYELLMMHLNGWSQRSELGIETFAV